MGNQLLTKDELLIKFGYKIDNYYSAIKSIKRNGNIDNLKINEFGSVHGYANGKSSRAFVAEERGLIKAGAISKYIEASAEFINDNCKEDEWHHVGSRKYHRVVNYYKPKTIIEWWFNGGGKEQWNKLQNNEFESVGNILLQEKGYWYYLINAMKNGRNFKCDKAYMYKYEKPNMVSSLVDFKMFTAKNFTKVDELDNKIHYRDWKLIV